MAGKVSIALATFNGGEYLADQLKSFTEQTRPPDELIVCDDGSIDDTVAILRAHAQSAPYETRIFLNEKTLGYSKNFSRALSLCQGDFVFLSDQDDVWDREKISKILEEFAQAPETQLLIHDLAYCKADLSPIGQTKLERMAGSFDVQRDYVVGMATAVRKTFLAACLPLPEVPGLNHDSWLHQCAWAIGRKKILPEVLALYRRHGANATAKDNLNVDFVTTPDHFKTEARKFGVLQRIQRMYQLERVIGSPEPTPLTLWLEKNAILLAEKFGGGPRINKLIAEDRARIESIKERLDFLSKSRFFRIVPVLNFLCRRKYRFFNGWTSAVKDLLVR